MDISKREHSYDVFLSYHTSDREHAESLAFRLETEVGLTVFLDKWHLIPGEPWQERLEEALDISASCAVFLGPGGLGPWQNEEMRVALDERVRDNSFRVIPVLLPSAELKDTKTLPYFLRRLTWVDFRGGLDDEAAFHYLVSGIRGIPPGRPNTAPEALDVSKEVVWMLILTAVGSSEEVSIDAVEIYLRKISGDRKLTAQNFNGEPVIIFIESSTSGFEKAFSQFREGQLKAVLSYKVITMIQVSIGGFIPFIEVSGAIFGFLLMFSMFVFMYFDEFNDSLAYVFHQTPQKNNRTLEFLLTIAGILGSYIGLLFYSVRFLPSRGKLMGQRLTLVVISSLLMLAHIVVEAKYLFGSDKSFLAGATGGGEGIAVLALFALYGVLIAVFGFSTYGFLVGRLKWLNTIRYAKEPPKRVSDDEVHTTNAEERRYLFWKLVAGIFTPICLFLSLLIPFSTGISFLYKVGKGSVLAFFASSLLVFIWLFIFRGRK